VPLAITGPVPEILLAAAVGAPPVNVAVPPEFDTGVKIFNALISAFVDLSVQIETPTLLVGVHPL
jgi:hypothetical protein